ncbi:hypothetical protein HUSEC41_26107 [Escherichia coli O104:H4 str. 01-09591]|nr:hypothetical protein HUSEC41_26107 [Escherichia coli O104:H4 str. 01-09591]
MQRSGMLSLMDAQARDTWYRSLEHDNFPEISEANILSTFEQLHQNKDEVFERGGDQRLKKKKQGTELELQNQLPLQIWQ